MRFQEAEDYFLHLWIAGVRRTRFLLGPPGCGKTSLTGSLAERMTAHVKSKHPGAADALFAAIDLSSRLPEDISGLPYREELEGQKNAEGRPMYVTEYAIQRWLAPFCAEDAYGVLCLDDLPAAAPAVQVAVRQLVLDRRVGDAALSPLVALFVTGNRRQDKAAASSLPSHFLNSVSVIEIMPALEEWRGWYSQDDKRSQLVPSFLSFKPELFSLLPSSADKNGSFATPRSWTFLGEECEIAQRKSNLFEIAQSFVGEGPAVTFAAYVAVRSSLVDPEEVLLDPEKALPNPKKTLDSPDKSHAMFTGLAETAVMWSKSKDREKRDKAATSFLRALGYVGRDNTHKDYLMLSLSTFRLAGGSIRSLVTAIQQLENEPDISKMTAFMRQVQNMSESGSR